MKILRDLILIIESVLPSKKGTSHQSCEKFHLQQIWKKSFICICNFRIVNHNLNKYFFFWLHIRRLWPYSWIRFVENYKQTMTMFRHNQLFVMSSQDNIIVVTQWKCLVTLWPHFRYYKYVFPLYCILSYIQAHTYPIRMMHTNILLHSICMKVNCFSA